MGGEECALRQPEVQEAEGAPSRDQVPRTGGGPAGRPRISEGGRRRRDARCRLLGVLDGGVRRCLPGDSACPVMKKKGEHPSWLSSSLHPSKEWWIIAPTK